MSTNVQELSADTFDQATQSGMTLVDFWAPWCGPCKMQGPIVNQVADRVGDKARVVKVNVDDAPELAARFGVRSIPTLVLLKDGDSVEQLVGLRQADDLVALIDKHAGQ